MSINVTENGGVVTVTLDYPERRNALGPGDARELADDLVRADPRVALVLTGRGAFCSGGDLRAFVEATRELTEDDISASIHRPIPVARFRLDSCTRSLAG